MKKTREDKAAIIDRMKRVFTESPSSVFVRFRGLDVESEHTMRAKLKDAGIAYFVGRKTLMRRALDESGVAGGAPELEGEIAVAHNASSDDPTAPARLIHEAAKELGPERLSIAGGIYEGSVLSADEMHEIATIPSMQVLRGMFVNVINSPIQGLAVALNQIAEKRS